MDIWMYIYGKSKSFLLVGIRPPPPSSPSSPHPHPLQFCCSLLSTWRKIICTRNPCDDLCILHITRNPCDDLYTLHMLAQSMWWSLYITYARAIHVMISIYYICSRNPCDDLYILHMLAQSMWWSLGLLNYRERNPRDDLEYITCFCTRNSIWWSLLILHMHAQGHVMIYTHYICTRNPCDDLYILHMHAHLYRDDLYMFSYARAIHVMITTYYICSRRSMWWSLHITYARAIHLAWSLCIVICNAQSTWWSLWYYICSRNQCDELYDITYHKKRTFCWGFIHVNMEYNLNKTCDNDMKHSSSEA